VFFFFFFFFSADQTILIGYSGIKYYTSFSATQRCPLRGGYYRNDGDMMVSELC